MITKPVSAGQTWSVQAGGGRCEPIALYAAGTLYVANAGANSITVYAPGAGGNATAIRTINGLSTGLTSPQLISLRQ